MKSVECRVGFCRVTGGDQKSGAFIRGNVWSRVIHFLSDRIGLVQQASRLFVVTHVSQNRGLQVEHLREVTGPRTILAAILYCPFDISQALFPSAGMYKGTAIFQIDLRSEKWILVKMGTEQDLSSPIDMLQTLRGARCRAEKGS